MRPSPTDTRAAKQQDPLGASSGNGNDDFDSVSTPPRKTNNFSSTSIAAGGGTGGAEGSGGNGSYAVGGTGAVGGGGAVDAVGAVGAVGGGGGGGGAHASGRWGLTRRGSAQNVAGSSNEDAMESDLDFIRELTRYRGARVQVQEDE